MISVVLGRIFSLLRDRIAVAWRSDHEHEIVRRRQHVRILQRTHSHPRRLSQWEKVDFAVLAARLVALSSTGRRRFAQASRVFKPNTLLKWYRELVRHTWTFKDRRRAGQPPIGSDLADLIVRLPNGHPRWGDGKLEGEPDARWAKLGYNIGRSTVRDVLKRNNVPPAPHRSHGGRSWRTFLRHYKDEILACDFFTVETAWLKTLYVLFFIGLGSRRVHLAGCTAKPTSAWVVQQARHLRWKIQDGDVRIHFFIRDCDSKFPTCRVRKVHPIKNVQNPVQYFMINPIGLKNG